MPRQAWKAMKNGGKAGNHGKSYGERSEGIPAIKSKICTPMLACDDCGGISGMTVSTRLHLQLTLSIEKITRNVGDRQFIEISIFSTGFEKRQ